MLSRMHRGLVPRHYISIFKSCIKLFFITLTAASVFAIALGGFASNFYWSSSDFDLNNSWFQSFNGGGQGTTFKDNFELVRAVRSF